MSCGNRRSAAVCAELAVGGPSQEWETQVETQKPAGDDRLAPRCDEERAILRGSVGDFSAGALVVMPAALERASLADDADTQEVLESRLLRRLGR